MPNIINKIVVRELESELKEAAGMLFVSFGGLTVEEWNEEAREAGLGKNRPADLYDLRNALKAKRLAHEGQGRWYAER